MTAKIDSQNARLRTRNVLTACAGLLALAASSAALQAQEGDKKAFEILDLNERTSIGDSKASGSVNMVIRGRCRFELSAGPGRGQPSEGSFVEYLAADGRARGKGSYGEEMSFEYGHDGKVLWESDPSVGLKIMPERQRIDRARTFMLKTGAPWRSLYRRVVVQEEKGDDVAIRMTPKQGSEETWWISRKTGYLRRILMPWGGQTITVVFDRHARHASGMLMPMRYRVELGFASIQYELESLDIVDKIEASRFKLPKAVLEKLVERRVLGGPSKAQSAIRVEDLKTRTTACIRVKIPRIDMGKTLSVLFPELYREIAKQGNTPIGPPFSRFHSAADGQIDLEAGFPVAKTMREAGRVKASELPAGKTAQTWHYGNYTELPKTYARMEAWIQEQGFEKNGASWEIYWTDPGQEKDVSKWKTRVIYPVRKARKSSESRGKQSPKKNGKRAEQGKRAKQGQKV